MATLSAIFKGVDQLSSVLDRMGDSGTDALNQWEDSMKAADEAFSRASEGADRAAEAATGAADAAGFWTNQIGNYDRGAMEAIYTTEELVEMGYKTEDALHDAADAADQAADAVEEYGDEAEEAGDQSEEFGGKSTQAVQSLAGILTSAGVVVMVKEIAQAFYEASEAAAEYETYLAKVSTIADPAQASLSTISGEITALSMETGKAVTELSDATYQALSAGVETANAVSFAGTATELAVGGFTTAATAVDVLTTALNAYGLEATYAENISDMLVTTQNLGKTTVDELASNMGRVIPLASAYGVEMDNLSTGYAVMTANGIATAETTTYLKSMLNELGTTSSTVAGVLLDETGMSFADLTAAGYSLGDVLGILGESVDGNTTAFNELWGSQEAGVGALSLYNAGAERFNTVLEDMRDSAGAAATAYDTMTDTTEHGSERMANSFDNLQISVGTVLNPTFDAFYNTVADGTDALTSFINEHPAVVAGLTAAAVALGVVVIGVVGYNAAVAAAGVVTAAFGAIASTALWPITLIVAGVAALVAGITVLVNWLKNEDEEFMALDATSKQHIETMDDLNAQYDEAVALYGENSEQARQLEQDMAALEAQYEGMEGTIEDFIAKNDALIDSHDKLISSYQETDSQLTSEERNTTALIGKLEQLAGKTNLSAGEQAQMSAIVAKLNEQVPGLALNYDEMAGSVDKSVAAIRAMAEAEAEEQRQQANYEAYVQLLSDRADLEEQVAKAAEQTAAAQERYDNASGWDQFWNVGGVNDDLETFTEEQERLQAALDETTALLEEQEAAFEEAASSAEDSAIDYETGVTRAISTVKEDLTELAEQYDEAWQAARDSIGGQIGLFDTMATETELSISDMTTAMQSQVEYLNTYSENLRLAAEYGLSEGLIASLSDGSTESAGYIDAIISNIEKLGGSTEGLSEDAAAFVTSFNTQFEEVEAAKDGFATTVATMETDFDASMTEIEGRLDSAIDNMNMDTEAATAAKATIDAYVASIRAGIDDASGAAAAVAAATNSALSGSGGVTGYATGTTYAEPGVHIVGEEGPEAIFFDGGETVLNATDTRQYLASQRPIQTAVPAPDAELEGGSIPGGERRIVLEIAGRGSLELTGGNVDPDAAAEWLMDNLRPMLISTLKQEIFEEGDATNAY